MAEVERVRPQEVHEKLKSGKLLLVCAYDDESKFKAMHLEGAISFSEFKARVPSLSRDQEIVFYCAWRNEGSAVGQAALYLGMGFKNVKALGGGVEGWKAAGYRLVG